jgi:ABC-2 type transport system ATP-binding protein
MEKCADFITFIDNGRIIASAEKERFIETYRLVNGRVDQLNQVKDKIISYKTNSFGFTGLILANDLEPDSELTSALPSLEEIMIYFAKKESAYV